MLANYNQKKEKLQRTQTPGGGKPTISPAGPSGIMTYQRRPSAGGGQERQPQYLAYLEKTLEKSDLTIQTVKQMNSQFKVLEKRVDDLNNLSYGHEELYSKFK